MASDAVISMLAAVIAKAFKAGCCWRSPIEGQYGDALFHLRLELEGLLVEINRRPIREREVGMALSPLPTHPFRGDEALPTSSICKELPQACAATQYMIHRFSGALPIELLPAIAAGFDPRLDHSPKCESED